MTPFRFALKATTVAVLTVFSLSSMGHSEHDKPRYVSTTGVDQGLCETPENACLTFGYAVSKANKGDRVLVASGDYTIKDPDSLFYLISDIIPVKAGFKTSDNFAKRDATNNITRLNGVPQKFANELRQKGFVVNTDMKTMSAEAKAALEIKLAQHESLSQRQSNVACVNGKAGEFDCQNIDLLSHVPLADFGIPGATGNDIWGHVDLNTGREYALMGLTNGFTVVDVTDPTAPSVVGSIEGQSTLWRDLKVHQYYDETTLTWKAFAYVTADNASVGLTIVDLNNLASGITVANVDKTDISAHNVFISNVDYSTGVALTGKEAVLHLAGANNRQGAFNSYRLNTATASVSQLYRPGIRDTYTHDVSAMVITDDRIQNQCSPSNGACEIFFDYNQTKVKIWDKTNNEQPSLLSNITYNNSRYVHSGWTSEDGQYLFVHDELDERDGGLNTTLRVFDISDLGNPQEVGSWVGPTRAIDHNGFVRGNRYYMSNYSRGLVVLDITNPVNPQTVGTFDTYPVDDSSAFRGAWGVYPYLPSGNILISDMNSGLYVLADKTVGTDNHDSVKFDAGSYEIDEGGNVVVSVQRSGDMQKAVSVRYETQVGSASGNDFEMVSGTLNWAAGDSTAKTITIAVNADSDDQEYNETFFVRMFDPRDGLSLTSPNIATINVKGQELSSFASFSADAMEIKENQGTVLVPVSRGGAFTGELTVDYAVTGGSAEAGSDYQLSSGTLNWGAGESGSKNIALELLNDSDSEAVETIVVQLTQTQSDVSHQTLTLSLRDDDSNQAPEVTVSDDTSVSGGDTVNLVAVATDPEGYPLTYKWQQTGGISVGIDDDLASSISFVAPTNSTTLSFEVTVTDDFNVTTAKSVTVTVDAGSTTPTPPPTPPGTGTVSSGGGALYVLPFAALLGLIRRRKYQPKI